MIIVKLFQKRVIGFGGNEMIDHVDGAGEEDLDIGITGCIGDAFAEEALPCAGVSDKDHIPVLGDKVQIVKIEDLDFLVLP